MIEFTRDDRARLKGIASAIQQAVDDGRFGPDFAERDVRFLRKLAERPAGDVEDQPEPEGLSDAERQRLYDPEAYRRLPWPPELTIGRLVDGLGVPFIAKPNAPIENPSEATEFRVYALADQTPSQPAGDTGLRKILKEIADVRSDATMPGIAEAFERRGELARAALADSTEGRG